MRKIQFLENNSVKEKIFDEDKTPDIVGFNKELMKIKNSELKSFKVRSKGKDVSVNLETGEIILDGQKIDLEIDSQTKSNLNINNLRWINFKRKRVSYRMAGLKTEESVGYGVGWQAKLNTENIKRFLFITQKGHKLEKK